MQLKANKISFGYSSKNKFLLKDVDFSLSSGEKVALVGPSGYGKSTFASMLAGYIKPDSGTIHLDGKPFDKKSFCPVQLIYQHPEKAINPRWKMKKVLEESTMFSEDTLKDLGIEKEWLNRFPSELSGGELQRFCIARALFSEAEIIIADEMSTMLDVITQAQLWSVLLKEHEKRNLGLLVVTHNIQLAESVCDSVIDLRHINNVKSSEII